MARNNLGFEPFSEEAYRAQDVRIAELANYLRKLDLNALASEVRDNHFSARIAELTRSSDYHELSIELNKLKEDRLVGDLKAIYAEQNKSSVNYNNVIAGLGYAGFLGVMSYTDDILPAPDAIMILLLYSASLMVFVFWTAALSVLSARAVRRTVPLFNADEEFDRRKIIDGFESARNRMNVELAAAQRLWAPTFIFSVLTGLLAAILLWSSLILQLIEPGSSMWRTISGPFACISCIFV